MFYEVLFCRLGEFLLIDLGLHQVPVIGPALFYIFDGVCGV